MCAGNAAPNNAGLGAIDGLLSTVDVSNSFSEVKLGILCDLDSFQLEERSVLIHISLGPLESSDLALGIESTGLRVSLLSYPQVAQTYR